MVSLDDFLSDFQGAKFKDVIDDDRINYEVVIDYFNDEVIRTRLCDSESWHDRPPLAGVIKEFELLPPVRSFFENNDGHTTQRFRQSIGVLVRLHMDDMGWEPQNKKGSLGTRVKVKSGDTTPGAYHNTDTSLSHWFLRAERYKLKPKA